MLKLDSHKYHHENWPAPLFYFPVFIYYLYTSLRFRKLNYFSAVNPALESGGMCGFSKIKSYKLIDNVYVPKTILKNKNQPVTKSELEKKLLERKISFPLIIKPDRGERGFLVHKVESLDESMEILSKYEGSMDFLVQEYIEGELELGVFIIKSDEGWAISSLVSKKFLSVVGDGKSTLLELCHKQPRAEKYFLGGEHKKNFDEQKVPLKGESVILEHIGNHCRGTEFVNEVSHNKKNLKKAFEPIVKSLKGLNYFRLDLRAESWASLEKGSFKVLEVNGVSAEPGHIYDPSVNIKQAYADLFYHWSKMSQIATEQISKGAKTEPLIETLKNVLGHLSNKRSIKKNTAERNLDVNKKTIVESCKGLSKMTGAQALEFVFKKLPSDLDCLFDGAEKCEGYDRLSLYKDDSSEVVLCKWHLNSNSGIHNHDGSDCWFKCLSGKISEYRKGVDKKILIQKNDISFINDSIDSHSMSNADKVPAFTLHYYRDSATESA